jgi:hypothetical protein
MPAMAMEHQPAGRPQAAIGDQADVAARALRAQLLATEHWSLLATRSLSWNESFSRAGMFLSLLSGSIVALALVAQATAFGDAFSVFALLLLPVVLYVGTATYVRLIEINNEDLVWVRGMNRLRRAYLELDPDLARHFITGTEEDAEGFMKTYGAPLEGSAFLHGLVTTPTTIGVVNAAVAAVLLAIVTTRFDQLMGPVAAVGIATFVLVFIVEAWYGYRALAMAAYGTAARSKPPDTSNE